MALKLSRGQELQIVVMPNPVSGFDVVTRGRVVLNGKAHEREQGAKVHAANETELWMKIAELAQEKLVAIGLAEG